MGGGVDARVATCQALVKLGPHVPLSRPMTPRAREWRCATREREGCGARAGQRDRMGTWLTAWLEKVIDTEGVELLRGLQRGKEVPSSILQWFGWFPGLHFPPDKARHKAQ